MSVGKLPLNITKRVIIIPAYNLAFNGRLFPLDIAYIVFDFQKGVAIKYVQCYNHHCIHDMYITWNNIYQIKGAVDIRQPIDGSYSIPLILYLEQTFAAKIVKLFGIEIGENAQIETTMVFDTELYASDYQTRSDLYWLVTHALQTAHKKFVEDGFLLWPPFECCTLDELSHKLRQYQIGFARRLPDDDDNYLLAPAEEPATTDKNEEAKTVSDSSTTSKESGEPEAGSSTESSEKEPEMKAAAESQPEAPEAVSSTQNTLDAAKDEAMEVVGEVESSEDSRSEKPSIEKKQTIQEPPEAAGEEQMVLESSKKELEVSRIRDETHQESKSTSRAPEPQKHGTEAVISSEQSSVPAMDAVVNEKKPETISQEQAPAPKEPNKKENQVVTKPSSQEKIPDTPDDNNPCHWILCSDDDEDSGSEEGDELEKSPDELDLERSFLEDDRTASTGHHIRAKEKELLLNRESWLNDAIVDCWAAITFRSLAKPNVRRFVYLAPAYFMGFLFDAHDENDRLQDHIVGRCLLPSYRHCMRRVLCYPRVIMPIRLERHWVLVAMENMEAALVHLRPRHSKLKYFVRRPRRSNNFTVNQDAELAEERAAIAQEKAKRADQRNDESESEIYSDDDKSSVSSADELNFNDDLEDGLPRDSPSSPLSQTLEIDGEPATEALVSETLPRPTPETIDNSGDEAYDMENEEPNDDADEDEEETKKRFVTTGASKPVFRVFDSLPEGSAERTQVAFEVFTELINKCLQLEGAGARLPPLRLNPEAFKVVYDNRIVQKNKYDCGCHALSYLEHYIKWQNAGKEPETIYTCPEELRKNMLQLFEGRGYFENLDDTPDASADTAPMPTNVAKTEDIDLSASQDGDVPVAGADEEINEIL